MPRKFVQLVGNFYIASAIEAFAEGMTLADRNDISRDAFMEFQRACFPSPISIGPAPVLLLHEFLDMKIKEL